MEDSATTAALVGIVMALGKLIEKGMAKANGGSVEFRLAALEKQVEEMKKTFYEFREQSRIRWAKEDSDE